MNKRQKQFVSEYFNHDGNAYKAALAAGYSQATARGHAHKLLQHVAVSAAINEQLDAHAMSANERLMILSNIARGDAQTSGRLRAIELLGKLAGDYTEKKAVSISGDSTIKYITENRPVNKC